MIYIKIDTAVQFVTPAPRAQLPKVPKNNFSGGRVLTQVPTQQIQNWPIERLVEYPRNPRKNDKAVDRMCASIREFGFKIPVLMREVVKWWTVIYGSKQHGSWEYAEIPVIPMRRVDTGASEGVSPDGEPIRDLG